MALVIIAKITAVEGKSEAVKAAILELVEPTLKEAGCIQYDMHQDLNNPHLFYVYERWETQAHLQAHSESEHIMAMRGKTTETIQNVELSYLKRI
jgi:quinol monooxygenase YgiN